MRTALEKSWRAPPWMIFGACPRGGPRRAPENGFLGRWRAKTFDCTLLNTLRWEMLKFTILPHLTSWESASQPASQPAHIIIKNQRRP